MKRKCAPPITIISSENKNDISSKVADLYAKIVRRQLDESKFDSVHKNEIIDKLIEFHSK